MNRSAIRTLALVAVIAAGCAHKPPPGPPPSGVLQEGMVSATATVKKINQKTREVTLSLPDGRTTTVHAGSEVRNLDRVKAGDLVTVTYIGQLSYQVVRKGQGATPGITIAQDAVRAEPGQMPGAAGARAVTITTTIKAIDKKAGTVTLAGLEGGEDVVVQARNPDNLDRIAVGDSVEITETEAIGIDVSSPRGASQ
jgi:Cu/Ag efflux protein CusF